MRIQIAAILAPALALAVSAHAAPPEACAKIIPYGIATRPEPTGTLVSQVLPAKIGRFVRDEVEDTVFVGLSRAGSPADVKAAVQTSRQDVVSDKRIDRRGEVYCVSSAPYFYKIPDFLAWTRGPFFLYAHGSSPAVLSEFMQAFPY